MAWVNITDLMYPVGSYYISNDSTSPSESFGGTWVQINDSRFLCGSTSITTGGANTHTLTTAQLPSHTHTGSTATAGAHTHTGRYSKYGYGSGGYYVLRRINSDDGYLGTDQVTNSAGGHTHTVTIGSTGGGSAHNNMPLYRTCYMWYRTA